MASTTASASSWSEIQKQTPSTNSTPDLTNFLADFISSLKQSSSTICNEKNNIKNCQSANTSEKNVVDKNLHNNVVIPDSVVQLSSTKTPLKQSEDGILSLEQVLNKMKSLEEINKKLDKENKQLSDWMDNDSNTIEDLTAQLEAAQKKINASEQEQSCLKIKVGELENVNKNLVEESKKKMEEEKLHQQKSAEIKAEIAKLDQNITFFNQQEKKGDKLPDKKTTPSLLGCLHKDLEQEKSELEEKLCELESLNKTEVKLYRVSREKAKNLAAQIAKLEKEILSIELENSSLKHDISQTKQQNALFQQTNMGIKKENTSLKNQNTTLIQHNVALKNQNSIVQQENSDLKKENTSLWQEKTSQAPPTPQIPCSVIFQNSLLEKQNSSLHQQNSFLKQEKTSTEQSFKADIKNLNDQIDNLKSEKKKLEDKVGDWMEEDNNAREDLLAQINEKHNKLALKTIKVEELEKSLASLTEEKKQLEERQSESEKENKQILKAFCKLELQLKEAKEGGLGEIGNLMKKNKGLEFEVERFKAVKLKNDMKIQMLEQKSKSSDEAKKQIELDLKNDDCKKKELIDKTRKEMEQLISENESHKFEVNRLKDNKAELKKTVSQLETSEAEKVRAIEDLMNIKEDLKIQNKEQDTKLLELECECHELTRKNHELTRRRQEADGLVEKMASEVAEMLQEHESKLKDKDWSLKEKDLQIKEKTNQFERIERKKDDEIHRLNSKLDRRSDRSQESYDERLKKMREKLNKDKEDEINKIIASNNTSGKILEEQISLLKADKERVENLVKSKQAQIEDLKQTNLRAQNDKKGLEARIETKMSESSTLNLVIAEKIRQIENLQQQNSSVKKCSDICEDNIFKISTLEKQWNKSQENIKLLKEETKLLERKVEDCDCTAVKRKRPSN